MRMSMSRVTLRLIELRHWGGCTTGRVNRHDWYRPAREQDASLRGPGAASEIGRGLRKHLHGSASGQGLLQLSIGEERDPATVRGPHRILRIVGSGQLVSLHTIQRAHPQRWFTALRFRAENEELAVGRERKRRNVDSRVDHWRKGALLA